MFNSAEEEFEEITPAYLRCMAGGCPGIYRRSNGNLVIVGKKLGEASLDRLHGKIADDEYAVEISPDYFTDAVLSSKF